MGPMSPKSMAVTSLEELLDSLRQRGNLKPKDIPPALPARPTSRTRPPSVRHASLPEIVETVMELNSSNKHANNGDSKRSRWKSLEVQRVKQVKEGEMSCHTATSGVPESAEKGSLHPEVSFGESESYENMEQTLKKVYICFISFNACFVTLLL